jgi:NADH dehydrogenase [ubiquinone] 1 alpha subcomplex assembly factor 2
VTQGSDLQGNTYWEFRSQLQAGHFRRILQPLDKKLHHSDVQLSPQWLQWLRYTRLEPPSIEELQQDVLRQERMKVLAKEADARWESKESFLVQPESMENRLIGQLKAANAEATGTPPDTVVFSAKNINDDKTSQEKHIEEKESPWKAAEKAIDEPEAWSPKVAKRL